MIGTEDIEIINKALASGADVRIQNTKDGCRIVADTVKVLKRIVSPDKKKK